MRSWSSPSRRPASWSPRGRSRTARHDSRSRDRTPRRDPAYPGAWQLLPARDRALARVRDRGRAPVRAVRRARAGPRLRRRFALARRLRKASAGSRARGPRTRRRRRRGRATLGALRARAPGAGRSHPGGRRLPGHGLFQLRAGAHPGARTGTVRVRPRAAPRRDLRGHRAERVLPCVPRRRAPPRSPRAQARARGGRDRSAPAPLPLLVRARVAVATRRRRSRSREHPALPASRNGARVAVLLGLDGRSRLRAVRPQDRDAGCPAPPRPRPPRGPAPWNRARMVPGTRAGKRGRRARQVGPGHRT